MTRSWHGGLVSSHLLTNRPNSLLGGFWRHGPSDFANSGDIVARHQMHFMELSGGSLRVHLPVHATLAGRTVGLLRCGPEQDADQVVAIPLARGCVGKCRRIYRDHGDALPYYSQSLEMLRRDSSTSKTRTVRQASQMDASGTWYMKDLPK